MKKIIAFTTALLMFASLNAMAHHKERHIYDQKRNGTAYRCFDVNDQVIQGIWNQRDAHLIDRVGGSCNARSQDDGDLYKLKQEALTKRDIKRALRKARKRFPELLNDAWLIGSYDVDNSRFKHIKYELLYSKLGTDERIKIKVKQNLWSGKIKRMHATTIVRNPHYNS